MNRRRIGGPGSLSLRSFKGETLSMHALRRPRQGTSMAEKGVGINEGHTATDSSDTNVLHGWLDLFSNWILHTVGLPRIV